MTADTGRFLDAAGEFLRADPARNTVMLTVTEDLRVTAAASAGTLFGWWRPDGEPVGAAFMHTPDYPLLLPARHPLRFIRERTRGFRPAGRR